MRADVLGVIGLVATLVMAKVATTTAATDQNLPVRLAGRAKDLASSPCHFLAPESILKAVRDKDSFWIKVRKSEAWRRLRRDSAGFAAAARRFWSVNGVQGMR
jgi:hypothetical protein